MRIVTLGLIHYIKILVRLGVLVIKLAASLVVFMIAIVPSIIARLICFNTNPKKILLAGNETSANLQQIGICLAKSGNYTVTVLQFFSHSFYSEVSTHEFGGSLIFDNRFLIPSLEYKKKLIRIGIRLKRKLKMILYFFKAIYSFDLVFFNWSQSFLPFNLDYPLLRISGKKIIVRHCGDDVRYRPLQDGIHSMFGIHQWRGAKRDNFDALSKFWHQLWAESFTVVLSTRDHATFQSRPLGIRPYVQSPLPSTTGFKADIPFILHAPSDPKIKGTHIFEEAIVILRHKGLNFNSEILTGVNHDVVLNALSKATIVVDQPGAVPARLAVEAMASGCVVVGGNVEAIHGLKNLPILQFPENAAELAEILCKYLSDNEKAIKLGESAQLYALENFSCTSFFDFFESILKNEHTTFNTLEKHDQYLKEIAQTRFEKLLVFFLMKIRGINLRKMV
jgi:glycosyltransferase involved in cell wall biosynthesis